MTNLAGALRNIGVGIEATRGTAVTPTHWIPIEEGVVLPVVEYADDDSNFGRLESLAGAEVIAENAALKATAIVRADWLGVILGHLLGNKSTSVTEADLAWLHTFTFQNDVAHPSLTVAMKDANADECSTFSMVNAFKLSCEAKGFLKAEIETIGKALASDTNTAAYDRNYRFKGPECTIKLADAISGLSGASAVAFHSFSLDFNTDILAHHSFGAVSLNKTVNQVLRVTGELKLLTDGNTYRDYVTDGTVKTLQIAFTKATNMTGAAYPASLTIQLAEVHFHSWDVTPGIREAAVETIGFTAHFDPTESTPQMLNIALQNDEAGTAYVEPA